MSDTTLLDKARTWIKNNVPRHTQAEYEELLMHNERLMLKLIAKCIAYDDLMQTHYELEAKVYETMPSAPFACRVDMNLDTMRMERVTTIEWRMDPLRANTAIRDYDSFRGRVDASEIAAAMRNHFIREVAPKLWEQAQACLYRAAAGAR